MVQHSPARSIPVAGRSRAIDIPVRRLGVRAVKFFDLAGNKQMAELAAEYIETREAWLEAADGRATQPNIAVVHGIPTNTLKELTDHATQILGVDFSI